MELDIGKKIKELRIEKGFTLRDLGEKTNLSIGFLSQLERGLTTIAVDSLSILAEILGVDLSYFFKISKKEKKHYLRSHEKEIFNIEESRYVNYLLSNNLSDKALLPRLIELLPSNSDENIEVYKHQGEEFIYILEGILTLYIDDQKHELYPGDSAHINSGLGHNWANYTNKLVKLIAVNTPNRFMEISE